MDEKDKIINELRRMTQWNENSPKEKGTYLVAWEDTKGQYYSVCNWDGDDWILNAVMAKRSGVEVLAWMPFAEYVF